MQSNILQKGFNLGLNQSDLQIYVCFILLLKVQGVGTFNSKGRDHRGELMHLPSGCSHSLCFQFSNYRSHRDVYYSNISTIFYYKEMYFSILGTFIFLPFILQYQHSFQTLLPLLEKKTVFTKCVVTLPSTVSIYFYYTVKMTSK